MRRDARRDAWIALASVPGIGEETFALLLATFGDAPSTFRCLDGRLDAWIAERARVEGRAPVSRTNPGRATRDSPTIRVVGWSPSIAMGLWTYTAARCGLSRRLRDLPAPPAVIHGLGDPATLAGHAPSELSARVAQPRPGVSWRRASPAGWLSVRRRSCRGLAVGIDGAAHAATLELDGATVGVIGAGHRRPGPRAHDRLRDDLVRSGGAVISEHHPDTHATSNT